MKQTSKMCCWDRENAVILCSFVNRFSGSCPGKEIALKFDTSRPLCKRSKRTFSRIAHGHPENYLGERQSLTTPSEHHGTGIKCNKGTKITKRYSKYNNRHKTQHGLTLCTPGRRTRNDVSIRLPVLLWVETGTILLTFYACIQLYMYSDIKLTDDPARHASTPFGHARTRRVARTKIRIARTEILNFSFPFVTRWSSRSLC
jgi:hypothetical protein